MNRLGFSWGFLRHNLPLHLGTAVMVLVAMVVASVELLFHRALGEGRGISWEVYSADDQRVLVQQVEGLRLLLTVVCILAVGIATALVHVGLANAFSRRCHEFATMRLLGATPGQVCRMVVAETTLRVAVEAGVTMIDTAEAYGAGRNESFIAPVLAPHRDRLLLSTKTGIRTRFGGLPAGLDGRPESIRKGLDGSLKRLGTDHVDLHYLHRVDPKVPLEVSVGALADGVRAGKARAIGVGIICYSPLGRGMLTGAPSATTNLVLLDHRRFLPRWRKENLAENLDALDVHLTEGDMVQLGDIRDRGERYGNLGVGAGE